MTKISILRKLLTVFIIFAIDLVAVGHATIVAFGRESAQANTSEESKKTNTTALTRKRHFEISQMGEIRDEDGTHLAFTAFKAADGTKLTVEHHEFESKLQAQQYFQKAVGKAPKAVVREKKTNAKGAVAGERAQVILESTAVSGPLQAVLWTSGPHFYEVFSTSLPDVLECEKRLSE